MKESRGYLEIAGKTQRDGILQILIKELGALVNVNLKYVPRSSDYIEENNHEHLAKNIHSHRTYHPQAKHSSSSPLL